MKKIISSLLAIFILLNMMSIGVFAEVIEDYVYFDDFNNGSFSALQFKAGSSAGTPGAIAEDPTDSSNLVYLFNAGDTYTNTIRTFAGRQTWEFDFMFDGIGMDSTFRLLDKNAGWAGFTAFEVKNGQLLSTTGKTYYLVPYELYHARIEFYPDKPMMETYVEGIASSTSDVSEANISLGDEGIIRSMASDSIGRIMFTADKTDLFVEDDEVWCWWDNLTITFPAPEFESTVIAENGTVNAGITEIPFTCNRALDSTTLKNITVTKNDTSLMYGEDFEVTFEGEGYYLSNMKIVLTEATSNADKFLVTFKNVKDFLPFEQTTYTEDQKMEFYVENKLVVNNFVTNTDLVIDNDAATITGIAIGENASALIADAVVNEGITISVVDNNGNDVAVDDNTMLYDGYKLRLSNGTDYFDYTLKITGALINYTFEGATAENHLDNSQRAAWKIAGVLPNASYGQVYFYNYGTNTPNVYISGAEGGSAKGSNAAMAFNFKDCISDTDTKGSMQLNGGLALGSLVHKGLVTVNIKPGADRTLFNFRTGAYNTPNAASIGRVEFKADGYLYFNNISVCKYTKDLWYNIGVAYDVNNTKSVVSLFVNGTKVVDKAELSGVTSSSVTGYGLTHEAEQAIAAGVTVNAVSLFDDFKIYELGNIDAVPYGISPKITSEIYTIKDVKVTVPIDTTVDDVKAGITGVLVEIYNADGTVATELDGTQKLVVYEAGNYISEYILHVSDGALEISGFIDGTPYIVDNSTYTITGIPYGTKVNSLTGAAETKDGVTFTLFDAEGDLVAVDNNTLIYDGYKLRLEKDDETVDYALKIDGVLVNYTFEGATADNHLDNSQRAAWKIAGVLPNASYGQVVFKNYGTTNTSNVYISGAEGGTAKGNNAAMAFNFKDCLSTKKTKAIIQLNGGINSGLVHKGVVTVNVKPGADRTLFNFRTGAYNTPNAAYVGRVEFKADGYLYFNKVSVCKYTKDVWYNIGIAYDINNTKSVASLYVNGEKLVDKAEISGLAATAVTGYGLTHEAEQAIAAGVTVNAVSLFDDFRIYALGDIDSVPYGISPVISSDEFEVSQGIITAKEGTTLADFKAGVTGAAFEIYNADSTVATELDGTQKLVVYEDGTYISEYAIKLVEEFYTIISGGEKTDTPVVGENIINCSATEGYMVIAVYNSGKLVKMHTTNLADAKSITVNVSSGDTLKLLHISDLINLTPLSPALDL